MNIALWVALAVLAASIAPSAAQADAQALPAGLLVCVAEVDDARRLACFDAAVAHAASTAGRAAAPTATAATTTATAATSLPAAAATATPTAPVATPTPAPTPPMSKEDAFGRRGDLQQAKDPGLQELESTVAKVDFKPHGELIVTLENGQVWAEIAPNSGIRVKSGDRVRIESGALGSFRLVAPNNRSSKVTRVR